VPYRKLIPKADKRYRFPIHDSLQKRMLCYGFLGLIALVRRIHHSVVCRGASNNHENRFRYRAYMVPCVQFSHDRRKRRDCQKHEQEHRTDGGIPYRFTVLPYCRGFHESGFSAVSLCKDTASASILPRSMRLTLLWSRSILQYNEYIKALHIYIVPGCLDRAFCIFHRVQQPALLPQRTEHGSHE